MARNREGPARSKPCRALGLLPQAVPIVHRAVIAAGNGEFVAGNGKVEFAFQYISPVEISSPEARISKAYLAIVHFKSSFANCRVSGDAARAPEPTPLKSQHHICRLVSHQRA